jgi:hypothetical protein
MSLGIKGQAAGTFTADKKGVVASYAYAVRATSDFRSGKGTASLNMSDTERSAMKGKGDRSSEASG